MDKSAEEITFDENGVCNFCHTAQRELQLAKQNIDKLDSFVEQIKKDGKGKKYDVLIGLSGGIDSSYTLHKAIELGLRPFCYSVDNGWNDPKADENILRMVEQLKVPFVRYTIDLKKFHELQSAFIKAGQKNLEIPTDHILMATTYEMASKYDIKWVLSGGNVATESIMPASWGYNARDLVHIKDVFFKMKHKKLTGLPTCGLLKWNYYRWIKKIKIFYILDHIHFNLKEATKTLVDTYGWKEYHEKHCESIFTWWFQNYYLFEKFGIDKRKAHLSSLINSGQMHRDEALALTGNNPVYPRVGLENRVHQYRHIPHTIFKTDEKLYKRISDFVKLWKS